MQAGFLPPPAVPAVDSADTDLLMTMLDGGLGAVVASSNATLSPDSASLCWCDCVPCIVGQ